MSLYVKIAKSAAEYFVRTGEAMAAPSGLPIELTCQRACYVSILENPGRRLRSLYGQPLPQRPTLAEEIITNTIESILSNPLRRLRRADLSYLIYQVGLLGPLQRISDPDHLDPTYFGLYVRSSKSKSALLLPMRAGIETAQDQIATALREARIDPRNEEVSMYRFDVHYFDA